MMNLSSLSPETIACIARGAVSLEQKYYYHSHGWSNRYSVIVTYPNGYGASIFCTEPLDGEADIWEVFLLKDGELCYGDDEWDAQIASDINEEEVIRICDHIYFM